MSRRRAPGALVLVGIAVSAAFLIPAAYLVWRNFTNDADPGGLLFSARTLEPLLRTLRLAITVSAATAVLGTSLAWLTTRTDLRFARFWRVILPLPLVFPTFVGAAAFISALNPGGLAADALGSIGVDGTPQLRGFFGAWLVLTLFTYPYVYLPVAARLRQLSGSLEESARMLGDSAFEAFRRIVLPQIAASITAGTVLVFLYAISDYGAVQLMGYDTLTRAIETNYLARPPIAFALSLILLVLAGVVVAIERAASRRMVVGAGSRSTRPVSYRLGRWRLPATLFTLIVALFAIGAPLAALLDWATDGLLRQSRGGRSLTIDRSTVIDATVNTLQVSVLAAIAAVVAVLPIAFLIGRYRSRLAEPMNAVIIATFAIPGILIALSLRFWTIRAGFAGDLLFDTLALLIFAYTVRFASLAMGVTLNAVRAVPHHLDDAAATLGASRMKRLLTIDLPLMRPGLLAAAGLVLLSVMKELPISLILAPFGFRTLTTRIFGSVNEAFVAEAGIMALVLVAMSAVLTWLLVLRRSDHL